MSRCTQRLRPEALLRRSPSHPSCPRASYGARSRIQSALGNGRRGAADIEDEVVGSEPVEDRRALLAEHAGPLDASDAEHNRAGPGLAS